jgi:hypothetical protein
MVELRRKIWAGSIFIVVKFCDCGYVSGAHCCFGPSRPISFSYRCLPSTLHDAAGARTKRSVVDSFDLVGTEAIKQVSIVWLSVVQDFWIFFLSGNHSRDSGSSY